MEAVVEPVHHGIMAFDIKEFGRLDRGNPIRGALRASFYESLEAGLRHAGISESECSLSDTGDGALVLFQPHVSKRRLLDPLLPWLARELATRNLRGSEREAVRLRAVVHAGEVTHDKNGVYGEDLNHAFRLLEASELRAWLTKTDVPLAVIVSKAVFDGIVRQGYSGIDAAAFVPVVVSIKETKNAPAWIWIPDIHPAEPSPAAAALRWERVSNALPPNPTFTGRCAELAKIREVLTGGNGRRPVPALHGLAGVGKSQVAREYAHRFADDYDVTWWIRAERPATILTDLAELARRVGLPDHGQRAQLVAALMAELPRHERWLLIFDHAERYDDIARYLPAGWRGHVIVTSRNRALGGITTPIKVKEFSGDEALRFLRRRTNADDRVAAEKLAEALGHLPLALAQAAAYIDKTGLTVNQYLDLYLRHREELLYMGRDDGYEHGSVETTFRLAFERIKDHAPAAAQLALLCSFMGPVTVPDDLIRSQPDLLPEPLGNVVRHEPTYLANARGTLVMHSLAELDHDGLRLHQLVQAVIRRQLPRPAQIVWATCAVQLLEAEWPTDPQEPAAWPRCRQLLHHVIVATELAEQLGTAPEATARLLRAGGIYHIEQAEPVTGAELLLAKGELERALAILEVTCRPDDPEIAVTLAHLSRALRRLDQLQEAKAVLERAVRIYEASGGDQPGLGAVFTYLGGTLRDLGDHGGAQASLQRALNLHETIFGPDSGKVAWTLTHLGRVSRRLGEHNSARANLERALIIDENVYGSDDHHIAQVLIHLGRVLRRLGDYDEARSVLERALRINEAVFGSEHHRTAETLIHIGALLRDEGSFIEARKRLERALRINEVVYGPVHYLTARTRTHLGRVLRRMEDLPAARVILEKALRDTERARGVEHPQVAWSLVHLSTVLHAQGEHKQAAAKLKRALGITERTYTPDHPDIAWILTHLSAVTILHDPQRQSAARAALERALAITEDVYGKNHLDVAWALTHVGGALRRIGQLSEARELLERALTITKATEATYGGRLHPQIIQTLIALGCTLRSLDETAMAQIHLEQAFDIASKRFGPDHPDTRAAWRAYHYQCP